MLGFILSKMQMLLFAVGIAVVALLFYDFISRLGLSEQGNTLVLSNAKLVESQLDNDLTCSDKFATLPDRLTYGVNEQSFFYDLEFSKQEIGTNSATPRNILTLRVVEHRRNETTPINVVASKSIVSDAGFVLVKPDFIFETSGLESSYDTSNPFVGIYPRSASAQGFQLSSVNAFVALKEVLHGKKTMYIIPCAPDKEPNNCVRNILRVGCYQLKISGNTNDDELVPSCFNVSTSASENLDKTKNYAWKDCKLLFPEVTS